MGPMFSLSSHDRGEESIIPHPPFRASVSRHAKIAGLRPELSMIAASLLLLSGCNRQEHGTLAACPHDLRFDRSKVIVVRSQVPDTVLRHDLDLTALAVESKDRTGPGQSQGLTAVEHQLAVRTHINTQPAQGGACVWLDHVVVDLTPSSVQIFIPREYSEDSCEYIAVLTHEREHERVNREHLSAAAANVRAALISANWLPARGNPLLVADRTKTEALLNDKIHKVVTPVYRQFKDDLLQAQAEIDKPELYQWVSKRCRGWK